LQSTSFKIDLKPGETNLSNIKTNIDYKGYQKENNRKTNGALSVSSVQLKKNLEKQGNRQTTISGLKGNVWPAPLVSMFAPKTKKTIEGLKLTAPISSKHSNVKLSQKDGKWSTLLDLNLNSISYNNVIASNASGIVEIINKQTKFKNVAMTFDYLDSEGFKKHGGKRYYKASVDKVTLKEGFSSFSNLRGTLWPGHISSMFNTNVAKTLNNLDLTSPLISQGSSMKFHYGNDNLTEGL